ncbi:uncharacterized protein EDB93DRAFT_179140 [Suillus bovinus]|uniref:uncharacterized protein n=1 Tax=Suillus bovinus TaxID=48563 RepID=UPI001B87D107|nr:uncharacterized protein EDB93DRAFT_179140 [Suillus bovinus]KAG2128046.1 hypothetical protein EDB93DRAFT_179140 [Suillus bovinus]
MPLAALVWLQGNMVCASQTEDAWFMGLPAFEDGVWTGDQSGDHPLQTRRLPLETPHESRYSVDGSLRTYNIDDGLTVCPRGDLAQ